jgi:hypothetical protein
MRDFKFLARRCLWFVYGILYLPSCLQIDRKENPILDEKHQYHNWFCNAFDGAFHPF